MMKCFVCLVVVWLMHLSSAGDAPAPLRLNHIQMIGTHNSYHVRPPQFIFDTLGKVYERVKDWDYTHPPLDIQLDHGVRNFELDIFSHVGGFAVFHVPWVDQRSTCATFMACMQVVRNWSLRNPKHIPISFLLEFKDLQTLLAGETNMTLDETLIDRLEAEILTVFPRDGLITPDDVRGDAPTLTEAVRNHGWPPLEASLGKVFFVLHNRTELRRVYGKDRPSLEGRLMFVNSAPDRDDAAFIVVDNPHAESIPDLIEQGMLVRVRSDTRLRQGHTGDTSRRDAAFDSGAHIISTDFPAGSPHPDTGYVTKFQDGAPARCNPINSPHACEQELSRILKQKNAHPRDP